MDKSSIRVRTASNNHAWMLLSWIKQRKVELDFEIIETQQDYDSNCTSVYEIWIEDPFVLVEFARFAVIARLEVL